MESYLQGKMMKTAKADGWVGFKVGAIGRRGFPDLLFIRDGVVLFVEVKQPGGRLSGWQKRVIAIMTAAGANVHVVKSETEFENVLGLYPRTE
jgi:hypothetical protein